VLGVCPELVVNEIAERGIHRTQLSLGHDQRRDVYGNLTVGFQSRRARQTAFKKHLFFERLHRAELSAIFQSLTGALIRGSFEQGR
jgi:hypothetical protein